MEPGESAVFEPFGSKTAVPEFRVNGTFTASYSCRATGPGIFWPAGTSQTRTRSLSITGFISAAGAVCQNSGPAPHAGGDPGALDDPVIRAGGTGACAHYQYLGNPALIVDAGINQCVRYARAAGLCRTDGGTPGGSWERHRAQFFDGERLPSG